MQNNEINIAAMGLKLKARRLFLGLSQSQVGDSLGVSFQQIQKYERGANAVSITMLPKIAKILKTDPYYLMGLDKPLQNIAKHHGLKNAYLEENLKREEIEIIKSYRAIKDLGVRQSVRIMLRSLGSLVEADE